MDLHHREQKIQEKRKKTNLRDFIQEMVSRFPLVLNKKDGLVSRYPASERNIPIIDYNQYNKDYSDGRPGQEYDDTKTFFENFRELYYNNPHPNLLYFGRVNENVHFCDCAFGSKNSYLSFVVGDTVDTVLYSSLVYSNCRQIYNSVSIFNSCDIVYHCIFVSRSFQVFFSKNIHNCADIRFSDSLLGCKECLFCSGLENQSYCIHNKQHTKEEYMQQKKEILMQKENFYQRYNELNTQGSSFASENVTGQANIFCDNIENGHYISRVHNGRNAIYGEGLDGTQEMYDVFDFGLNSKYFYGVLGAGNNAESLYLTSQVDHGSNLYYSYFIVDCSYCLGCFGLKNKQFCILNKQYTKEAWHEKVNDIFARMDQEGVLGQFFPPSMNPFYFNDTAAMLIGDFTKEEVLAAGFMWREQEVKVDIPVGAEVIKTSELGKYESYVIPTEVEGSQTTTKRFLDSALLHSKGQWHIDPSILKKIIVDDKGNYYRIVKTEYDFLLKHGLPLPTLHRLDRLKQNFTLDI